MKGGFKNLETNTNVLWIQSEKNFELDDDMDFELKTQQPVDSMPVTNEPVLPQPVEEVKTKGRRRGSKTRKAKDNN